MRREAMQLFLLAFAWTVSVELLVLALFAPRPYRRRILFGGLAANLITHPIAFGVAPELGFWPTEALVVTAETWIFVLAGLGVWPRALVWSLLANVASASGALLLA